MYNEGLIWILREAFHGSCAWSPGGRVKLAQEMGFCRVVVDCDNVEVARMLKGEFTELWLCFNPCVASSLSWKNALSSVFTGSPTFQLIILLLLRPHYLWGFICWGILLPSSRLDWCMIPVAYHTIGIDIAVYPQFVLVLSLFYQENKYVNVLIFLKHTLSQLEEKLYFSHFLIIYKSTFYFLNFLFHFYNLICLIIFPHSYTSK